jgi:uncharacterized coiled-coil protein SlyX
MNENEFQDVLEDLQTKLVFQEDLIQKLDEALGSQQQQLMDLDRRVELLMGQIRMMENTIPSGPETPPPHY